MLTNLRQGVNELLGRTETASLFSFTIADFRDFPAEEWLKREAVYREQYSIYEGEWLESTKDQGGRIVEMYPIRLNPIKGAVLKAAYALFGDAKDDSRPLATPILKGDNRKKKDVSAKGQHFLNSLWAENSGRTIMMRNGILSQIHGGCVFKASFIPISKFKLRKFPIRIESIYPSNFVGIPMSGDEFRLEEAWIVRAVSQREAQTVYGIEVPTNTRKEENLYYMEYWNPEEYEVTINNRPVMTGLRDEEGIDIPFKGRNRFGEVPILYIPRIRSSGMWGEALVTPHLKNLVSEINIRQADYGDAVSDDSHQFAGITNTPERPEVYELVPGFRAIHLKSNPTITGKELEPHIEMLGGGKANQSMKDINDQLYMHFRRETNIPAVADGEDEGSQRSSLTLAMRMWPLLSVTSIQRVNWSDGLAIFDKMLLRFAHEREYADIPAEALDMRVERRWSPTLPRDREVFINEMVSRASANLGSLEHLLSLFDDIDDPKGEVEEVKKFLKELAEIAVKAKPDNSSGSKSNMDSDNMNDDMNKNMSAKKGVK